VLAFILFLILVWVALGIIGVVVKGLFVLFIVACVLFAITLIWGALTGGRRGRVTR
jgi:hypothetical protein